MVGPRKANLAFLGFYGVVMVLQQTKFRKIKKILYRLKRVYGIEAAIYDTDITPPNLRTGVQTITREKISIPRMIILPVRIQSQFEYDLSFIAANKNFTMGGNFDAADRSVLIDQADLPAGFEFEARHYIVFDNARYDIRDRTELDYNLAIFLRLRKVQEEKPYQIFEPLVWDRLNFVETIVVT